MCLDIAGLDHLLFLIASDFEAFLGVKFELFILEGQQVNIWVQINSRMFGLASLLRSLIQRHLLSRLCRLNPRMRWQRFLLFIQESFSIRTFISSKLGLTLVFHLYGIWSLLFVTKATVNGLIWIDIPLTLLIDSFHLIFLIQRACIENLGCQRSVGVCFLLWLGLL